MAIGEVLLYVAVVGIHIFDDGGHSVIYKLKQWFQEPAHLLWLSVFVEGPVGENDVSVVAVRYLEESVFAISGSDQKEPFFLVGEFALQRFLILGQVVFFVTMIPGAFVIKRFPLCGCTARNLKPDLPGLVIVYRLENRQCLLDLQKKCEGFLIQIDIVLQGAVEDAVKGR